jgi:assimilatory nitrate reductase electron transfer subunit
VLLSDPVGGRHIEVVVADGRVVGATCVGAGPVAADLTAACTHATPAPSDPAQLLVRPVAGAAVPVASPTLMPERTTVCRCNGVTKGEVVACWRDGGDTVEDVARQTRATTGCGGCTDVVCGLLDWLATTEPDRSSRVSGGTDSAASAPGSTSSVKREPRRAPCCGSEMLSSASRSR